MPNRNFIRPIDLTFGPDGALYLIEYGTTWGKNIDAKIVRIDYARGNRSPKIKFSADQTAGKAPLVINLSTKGTFDPDEGDQLAYEWRKFLETVPSFPLSQILASPLRTLAIIKLC